jgi:hypothetical protein
LARSALVAVVDPLPGRIDGGGNELAMASTPAPSSCFAMLKRRLCSTTPKPISAWID